MEALKLFQEYMGTGLIMIWFLVSLLYLWVTEKRNKRLYNRWNKTYNG